MMTNPAAKTIQIFLPSGEPRGVRIAEFTNRTVQAIVVPRSDLAEAKLRAELGHIAVYFLFGESEESAKPIVYIGQTEDVRKRLDNHNSKKHFWKTAVLVVSRIQTFTQAHIRYLEWHCLRMAKETGRFAIDNDVQPGKPFVTEPMEADLLDIFDTLNVLVSTVGYPVFEPLVSKSTNTESFFLKTNECDAEGNFVEDGFVVRAGAIARKEITPSGIDLIEPVRTLLIESGVLIDQGANLRFTQDYLFNSPSRAAIVVLGRRANGWTEWKDALGRSLDEVYRADGDA